MKIQTSDHAANTYGFHVDGLICYSFPHRQTNDMMPNCVSVQHMDIVLNTKEDILMFLCVQNKHIHTGLELLEDESILGELSL